ncbi:MAG: putative NAD(P)H nitroreductase YfkO [Syntrophorhabdus sp. PtaU1.Bin153]|nr:MAG: putative NAD(P)H nitroreductase YfkO [Syntrophorhabdus sp. PtaU1.Bin153]
MVFRDIVTQRFAAKKFDERKIAEKTVWELIELIRFAPSAFNLQPWKIKVISDQEVKDVLSEVTPGGREQVRSCSHLLVFCANTDTNKLIEKTSEALKKMGPLDSLQTVMLSTAKRVTGEMSLEAKTEWAKCQVFLALGNAVNGATALGFDSCPMTGFNRSEYSRILAIPDSLIPTVLCALGYGIERPLFKLRFPAEDLLL